MHDATFFLAPHGAHFSNMIFLPRGSGVMEISPGCSFAYPVKTSRTAGTTAMKEWLGVYGVQLFACSPVFFDEYFPQELRTRDLSNCNFARGTAKSCLITLEKEEFVLIFKLLVSYVIPGSTL
mmetsp:Transcript_23686/g.58885  ORF Transcript_23686/g.58885 Transcript_23686/m.58885 type:complete len:123 (-) Transcript_23686:41-409(-)